MTGVILSLVFALATFLFRFGTKDPSERIDAKRQLRRQKLDDWVALCAQQANAAIATAPTQSPTAIDDYEVKLRAAAAEFLKCCGLTADMRLFLVAYHLKHLIEWLAGFSLVVFVLMIIPLIVKVSGQSGNQAPAVAQTEQSLESMSMYIVGPTIAVLVIVFAVRAVLNEIDKLSIHEVE